MKILLNECNPDEKTGIKFQKGDDIWRTSLWITYRWMKKVYWICIFF